MSRAAWVGCRAGYQEIEAFQCWPQVGAGMPGSGRSFCQGGCFITYRCKGSGLLHHETLRASQAGRTAVVAEDVRRQRRPPPVAEAEAADRAVAAAAGAQAAVSVLCMYQTMKVF